MVFGFFGKEKKDFKQRLQHLEKALEESKKQIGILAGDTSMWLYDADVRMEDLEEQIRNIQGGKTPKQPKTKIKMPTTQAILNILENNKTPLDFDYIFDNINKYDLKRKNPSPALVKRSIYNLIYNGKVVCGKKRGTYQICESPTKH